MGRKHREYFPQESNLLPHTHRFHSDKCDALLGCDAFKPERPCETVSIQVPSNSGASVLFTYIGMPEALAG